MTHNHDDGEMCETCQAAYDLAQALGLLLHGKPADVVINALGMAMADVLTCYDGGDSFATAQGSDRLEVFSRTATAIINHSYRLDTMEREEAPKETLQ